MLRNALFLFLLSAASLRAADYTFIDQLPQKLEKVKAECHKLWDTGNRADMQDGCYKYNKALVGMMKDLAKTYYSEKSFQKGQIDKYVEALYTMRHFRQDASNPSGEFLGTQSYVDVPADVGGDLTDVVAEMVKAITLDASDFDYDAWKKRWRKSVESV